VLIATVENALETERYQPYGQQAFLPCAKWPFILRFVMFYAFFTVAVAWAIINSASFSSFRSLMKCLEITASLMNGLIELKWLWQFAQ
jgi:hypothetical protein